jgi:(E)-4-hydroxy-3-methylbut-2-enyl-diphosphate synthase
MRKTTKAVKLGNLILGNQNPIIIQSMTTTYTEDISATVAQINALHSAGCEVVRFAVPTLEAAQAIKAIKLGTNIPLVADIHFDYRLAIKSIENGIDKVRINPGNIGTDEKIREVVRALKERNIPVRIGVNSGSIEKELLTRYGGPTPEAMVESALRHVHLLEKFDYDNIVISLKSSHVPHMVAAYRQLSARVAYPLHLGVTEAGTFYQSSVKSAMGIGALLIDGIGDTIRVSITGDPVQEIQAAKAILNASEARLMGLQIISCPTCGRCHINLESIVDEVEASLKHITVPITVAIMGCAVNGPGEAREADIGIAGGKGEVLLFKKGEVIGKYKDTDAVSALKSEIESLLVNGA